MAALSRQPKAVSVMVAPVKTAFSILELSELVKAIQDKFGEVATTSTAISAGDATTSRVMGPALSAALRHSDKVSAIKAVRELTGLGLREAKELVEQSRRAGHEVAHSVHSSGSRPVEASRLHTTLTVNDAVNRIFVVAVDEPPTESAIEQALSALDLRAKDQMFDALAIAFNGSDRPSPRKIEELANLGVTVVPDDEGLPASARAERYRRRLLSLRGVSSASAEDNVQLRRHG